MRALFTIGLVSVAAIASACSSGTGGGTNGSGSGTAGSGSAASGAAGGSGGAGSGSATSGLASSGGGAGSGVASSGGGSGTSSGSGGSSGSDGGAASSGNAGSGMDGGLSPAPYPSGPYCAAPGAAPNDHIATGCVIPNLTWNGYVDDAADAIATSKPYRSYSLLDVFNDARASGKKYAMLNIAEFYCPGCQNSAKVMGGTGAMSGPTVVAAGGVMIEVLMTNAGAAPTKANLDSWIGSASLNITTVADLDPNTPTFKALGRRDQAYIIDLTTMKVLQYINGSIVNAGNMNSGALGMAAMHTLLGK
jgi:hypothetical protein